MLYRLHVLNGPLRGQQVTVGPEPVTVGRDGACDLVIPDAEVALHHAVFEHREHGLFVRDLGAMGRVLVNRREQREARLKHGDVVELAHTRLLVQAVVQSETPAPQQLRQQLRLARWVALLTLFCVVTVAALLIPRHLPRRPPPGPAVPPVTNTVRVTTTVPVTNTVRVTTMVPVTNTVPVVMVVTSPPPTAELRQMHEELEIVREAMRLLATRTAAPPVVVTVTAAPPPVVKLPAVPPAVVSSALPPVVLKVVPPVAVPPAPVAEPLATVPLVQIVTVEQQRLPAPSAFEDLRLLHITLALVASNAPQATTCTVRTDFFDEDEYSGRIAPTEALTPRAELHPEPLHSGSPITLTASYAVPAGLRDRQLAAGRKVRYAGYRVRVYAGAALQAEEIHPRWLLEGKP